MGSILEGPGSIFRGFGRRRRCLKAFLGGKHCATDLSYVIGPFVSEKWPRSCRATERLPRMPVLPCPGGDGRGAHGVGWPAVSPPWGLSIRRPPKVCQRRAELISNWLCRITGSQSQHSFAQFDLKCPKPLSFPFPRSLGTTANPTPKSGKVWFFHIFGRFFRLPNRA